jgi:general secretion pathway protein B
MSLILEALRKSEAERRRGESPDLYAELPPLMRTRHRPLPVWSWLVIGLAALALVVWLLQSVRQPPAPAAVEATTSQTTGNDIAPAVVAQAQPPRPNAPTTTLPTPVVEPARKPVPDIVVAEPPAVASPPRAPAAAPDIAEPAPPPVAAPDTLPESPPVPAASDADLLRLADLSAEQRKQLPPLKISMHMWNDAPAQRFVIIDGNRLVEGDRIGDAVLEAIRADGVVLNWNGLRLKLPIR